MLNPATGRIHRNRRSALLAAVFLLLASGPALAAEDEPGENRDVVARREFGTTLRAARTWSNHRLSRWHAVDHDVEERTDRKPDCRADGDENPQHAANGTRPPARNRAIVGASDRH